jgi:DNA repair protein RadC
LPGSAGLRRENMKNVVQEKLFYYTDEPTETRKKYYWISTRVVRESGPWEAPPLKSPDDVRDLMVNHLDLENCDREHFVVAYLNRKGYLNAVHVVSIGGLHSSIVHPREVFKPAFETSSASIILAHNHPSGDPTPSQEDIEITRRLIEAGNILGITVLDHIVIGSGRYVSLKNRGLI